MVGHVLGQSPHMCASTCPAAGMASASVQQTHPQLPPLLFEQRLLQTKGGINHLPGPNAAGLTGPTTTGQTGPTTTGPTTSGETTAEAAAAATIPAGCDLNGEDISGTRLHVNMTGVHVVAYKRCTPL